LRLSHKSEEHHCKDRRGEPVAVVTHPLVHCAAVSISPVASSASTMRRTPSRGSPAPSVTSGADSPRDPKRANARLPVRGSGTTSGRRVEVCLLTSSSLMSRGSSSTLCVKLDRRLACSPTCKQSKYLAYRGGRTADLRGDPLQALALSPQGRDLLCALLGHYTLYLRTSFDKPPAIPIGRASQGRVEAVTDPSPVISWP
jgi:hypothetical protein